MNHYRTRYGIDFPVEVHDIQVELLCAKKFREPAYRAGDLLRPGEHLLRAIRALFTREEWSISPWTEEHAHAWCDEKSLGVIGCASSSKSNDIGGFCVLDWITDPLDTITIMASTSKLALSDRSYESVLRYFKILKSNPHFMIPGKESKTTMAIINDSDDEYGKLATTKAAIRGVAVQEGTADEARANLQGRHMPYVRLICDEFAQMKEAAAEARTNLRIGASKDFKWVFLANPDSLFDLSAKFSEPVDGWQSVDENTPRWRSRYALVLHHNGFQSPAITDPEGATKYPYLISQEQIDDIVAEEHGNEDSKNIWTMVKGFPPRTTGDLTVMSETDLSAFGMTDRVFWDDRGGARVMVAGLDPAFTSGGDKCVLQPAEVGLAREGSFVMAFHDPIYIPIRESSPRPAAYQVVDGLVEACGRLHIPIANVAIDDSGTQSIADIVVVETGQHPIRASFGAVASESPLSSLNLHPARERFGNLVTEIWALTAEFGRFRQIRQFPTVAGQHFCTRRYKFSGRTKSLEPKRDYKKRLRGQSSPDEGDALALCAEAARRAAGLRAGFTDLAPRGGSLGGRTFFGVPRPKNVNRIRSGYTSGIDTKRLGGYITPSNM